MKRMGVFLVTFLLSFHTLGFAKEQTKAVINYAQWEKVLNVYVNDKGLVNYEDLKNNRNILDLFIENEIQNADITGFSENQRKAFWINAYNALTLKLIIDNYPPWLNTIRSINWGRPWDVQFKAASRQITLNEIEHEILRKTGDPRIHFAINCASLGCPLLPDTHFNPEILDQQLEQAAKDFINNSDKVRLDKEKNILYHSAIFNWFKEDFLIRHDTLLDYILEYLNNEDKKYISDNKEKIKLKEIKYDWELNKQ